MVTTTTLIIIIVSVVVVIGIIIGIIVYTTSKHPSGGTGASGITGTCANECTIVPINCTATNVFTYGFKGETCPTSCLSTTGTTQVVGCAPPVCGSSYCFPQQTLYSTVGSNNSVINICNTGSSGTGFTSNTCTDPTTSGEYLSTLSVQGSSISNNKIFPIFITSIQNSIYQPVQPTPPTGIDVSTIQVNTTNPEISNNPNILYMEPTTGVLCFLSLNYIKDNNLDITNAIFIYDTDGIGSLIPFKDLGTPNSITLETMWNGASLSSTELAYPVSNNGINSCGFVFYDKGNTTPFTQALVYNPAPGKFQVTQQNGTGFLTYSYIGYLGETLQFTIQDIHPGGITSNNIVTTAPALFFTFDFPTPCSYYDNSRWYSISAIQQYI